MNLSMSWWLDWVRNSFYAFKILELQQAFPISEKKNCIISKNKSIIKSLKLRKFVNYKFLHRQKKNIVELFINQVLYLFMSIGSLK
jgi:hypothetical protein